jgi:lipoprotein-anchoring transpeptidase ErfK/SrfK
VAPTVKKEVAKAPVPPPKVAEPPVVADIVVEAKKPAPPAPVKEAVTPLPATPPPPPPPPVGPALPALKVEKKEVIVPPQPVPEVRRALPVQSDEPRSKRDFATWQIQMERMHFAAGTIDGDWGMRSERALRQYQRAEGLPVTGLLDARTRNHMGQPARPFIEYTVTAADMAKVDPTPASFLAKSKKTYLGYNSGMEMIAEKFHSRPEFIQYLNPDLGVVQTGTRLTVPNLEPAAPLKRAASIRIVMAETTMIVMGENGRPIAVFPCSIARNKDKRPEGELKVVTIAPNPNYTFDPELLKEAAKKEGITRRIILPPGPNNPVGLAWIGLSLPGYGIHGTPEPTAISRTGSLGCFRLANWNALKLLKMVRPGVPVYVEPSGG